MAKQNKHKRRTGKMDKNKKEIFEGDTVRLTYYTFDYGTEVKCQETDVIKKHGNTYYVVNAEGVLLPLEFVAYPEYDIEIIENKEENKI